jgi:hypothetical protein
MATTWSQRARQLGRRARNAGAQMGRKSGQTMQRVASQAPEVARRAGRALARHVVSVQRSAGLDKSRAGQKLMEQSYQLTVGEHEAAEPSAEWVAGYAEQVAAMVPAVRMEQEQAAARAAVQPTEPEAADAGRQYEPTPYDLDLTQDAEMGWPEWREARAAEAQAGYPDAAAPCIQLAEPEAEAEL